MIKIMQAFGVVHKTIKSLLFASHDREILVGLEQGNMNLYSLIRNIGILLMAVLYELYYTIMTYSRLYKLRALRYITALCAPYIGIAAALILEFHSTGSLDLTMFVIMISVFFTGHPFFMLLAIICSSAKTVLSVYAGETPDANQLGMIDSILFMQWDKVIKSVEQYKYVWKYAKWPLLTLQDFLGLLVRC